MIKTTFVALLFGLASTQASPNTSTPSILNKKLPFVKD